MLHHRSAGSSGGHQVRGGRTETSSHSSHPTERAPDGACTGAHRRPGWLAAYFARLFIVVVNIPPKIFRPRGWTSFITSDGR